MTLQIAFARFPVHSGANSKGFIPDALQGGLNLSARRDLSSKSAIVAMSSLCGEEAILDFVGACLDGDSVSALPLVGEFGQFVVKSTGRIAGSRWSNVFALTLLVRIFDASSRKVTGRSIFTNK